MSTNADRKLTYTQKAACKLNIWGGWFDVKEEIIVSFHGYCFEVQKGKYGSGIKTTCKSRLFEDMDFTIIETFSNLENILQDLIYLKTYCIIITQQTLS